MNQLKNKRIVCLFLGIVMLFAFLSGCQISPEPAEGGTTEQTSEPTAITDVYLIDEGVCEYSVVYAKDSEDAQQAAKKLAQVFQVKYKITLSVKDSASVSYDANAKEIYIGNTGFEESAEAAKNLQTKDSHCITAVKNKFVFVAGRESLLTEAVEYYISDILPNCVSFNADTGKASVKITECVVKTSSGSSALHSRIAIGEVDLKQFTIVYEEESEALIKEYAQMLRDAVVGAYGVTLPMVGDKSSEETKYEILVGNTNRAESEIFSEAQGRELLKYDIGAQGTKYVIVGAGYFSTKCAVQRFTNTYLYSLSEQVLIPTETVLSKADFVGEVAHAEGSDLRLMTLNVMSEVYAMTYYGEDPPTPPERIEIIEALLKAYSPDLVGLQEMTPWWQETFAKYLDSDEWGIYSATTNDLAHAILYHKSTVTLLESQTTPYYSDGSQRAWMVWGKFRVKSSEEEVLFSSTHWHPTDDTIKDYEASKLAETVVRLRQENANIPIFCTGDYNTSYGHARYQEFLETSGLKDTFDIAKAAGKTVNEVNGNGTPGMVRGNRPYTSNVDHIFCESYVTVGRYESVLENQITNLTDHAPRYADVSW